MKPTPRICILRTDGTNCDRETAHAVELAGGMSVPVHVNELREQSVALTEFQGLIIPGGFSYGDDLASGQILAIELMSHLKDQVFELNGRNAPILGICNGFQVLIRTGLVPWQQPGYVAGALLDNISGHFQCQWVDLDIERSPCIFTQGMEGERITLQIAHGEGRYALSPIHAMHMIEGLIPLRYAEDVNGSTNKIASLCSPNGSVFGLMPHPERYVHSYQHPNWRRRREVPPHGLAIFQNMVAYAAGL
jgi:phosphoribosylformylglycinamidine synthase